MWRRTRPFSEMHGLFGQLDDLLSWPVAARSVPAVASGYPVAEAFTRDDDIVVRVELPGVAREDVEITVDDGRLVIRGEKKVAAEDDKTDYLFREVYRGSFERTFKLPETAKADEVSARFEHGVLEVTVPTAKPEEKARKVPIQSLPDGQKAA
jgi:HSP20 family protein